MSHVSFAIALFVFVVSVAGSLVLPAQRPAPDAKSTLQNESNPVQPHEPNYNQPPENLEGLLKQFANLLDELIQAKQKGLLEQVIEISERLRIVERTLLQKHELRPPELRNKISNSRYNNLKFLSEAYVERARYDDAVDVQTEFVDFVSATLGRDHYQAIEARLDLKHTKLLKTLAKEQVAEIRQADTLNERVIKEYGAGNYAAALKLAIQVSAIRQKNLGGQHPDYAASLNNLAYLYENMGDFARAEPLYQQALNIRKSGFGEQHPEYAASLNGLAGLYQSMGDYSRAEPLYRKALEIRKVALGEQHLDYAASLNNLAVLYKSMGDYALAEPLYRQASNIWKAALGEQHPDYATSLNNLADLYLSMGDYTRTESLFQQALKIRQAAFGEQHPEYATSLNNLAALYNSIGDYARAEPLYQQALKINKAVLGEQHPYYAASLNNLARLYVSMGDYARAEPLHQEALKVNKATVGERHPEYATSLNNLATLYVSMGNYTRAEPLYQQALKINKANLGKQHPRYAATLNNLAVLYNSTGDYARAEPLYQEALATRKAILGERHPEYATNLNNLGLLYASMGDYARAEPLSRQALKIYKAALGEQHPEYALSLNNLALLYDGMGDYARAEPLYQQALAISRKSLDDTAYVLSERQQLAMNQSLRHRLDNYLNTCLAAPSVPPRAVENVLLWKGSVLVRLRGLRAAADDPAIADQFKKLQQAAAQLSKLAQAVPDPKESENWKALVAKLTAEKEALEAELMRSSAVFREAVKQVTFGQIQQAIPDDGVLVDYLEFNGKSGRELLVSIVKPEGQPVMIGLGSATEVSTAIDVWRETFGMSPQAKAAGLKLRKQIWEPVLEHLGDAKTILVSTDGALGRMPLAALPGKKAGSYLIEDHRLALIPVPQLLPALVNEQGRKQLQHELLLMGDVNYDSAPEIDRGKPAESSAPATSPGQTRQLSGTIRGQVRWKPLTGTKAEVEFIANLYKQIFGSDHDAVLELRQSDASETAFRNLAPEAELVHLATHGFFAAADKKSALAPEQVAMRKQYRAGQFGEQQREAIRGFSPGQLSGIVFAGANQPPAKVDPLQPYKNTDDGIMTSDEIAFLRLEGVRLVVLSACETGLGEVAGGEGLLGIQRGFQIGGARTSVASLWKVNDAATQRLMQEFYTRLLDEKLSTLDALRETQLWALNHPQELFQSQSNENRGVKRVVDNDANSQDQTRLPPEYWAAFVLSGDWR